MEIVKIISEHKRIPKLNPVRRGYKRVMALIRNEAEVVTRHIEIPL
jgi:hypothetical protein